MGILLSLVIISGCNYNPEDCDEWSYKEIEKFKLKMKYVLKDNLRDKYMNKSMTINCSNYNEIGTKEKTIKGWDFEVLNFSCNTSEYYQELLVGDGNIRTYVDTWGAKMFWAKRDIDPTREYFWYNDDESVFVPVKGRCISWHKTE